MRTKAALPETLGRNFTVSGAAQAGVSRRRRDASDLARPYHGVRAKQVPETFQARALCYAPRLAPNQRYGGKTAARIWRWPVPSEWEKSDELDVYAPTGETRPRTNSVQGHRLAAERLTTSRLDRMPVLDQIATLFTCAGELTVAQAVVLIDAILTTAENYPDRRSSNPYVTREDIADRLASWGRFPGCGTIRRALELAREDVESPKETETRLLICAHGLAEPVVQHSVYDGFRLVARIDLAYPDLKIAIEYEGDGHRTSPEQWRRDIQRQRELEERGWIVIRLTQADLDDVEALIRRIRNAIASRSRA